MPMRLPAPLLRNNPRVHKNDFGHVLILAGSRRMLGAAALAGLAAMRSGSGLVTLGIPQSLNNIIQKKISNTIMTFPLHETKEGTLSSEALRSIKDFYKKCDCIALGPGLTTHASTQKLIHNVIKTSPEPLIIDADALNALAGDLKILKITQTAKILTPHLGEFSRLIKNKRPMNEKNRLKIALDLAKDYQCTLLLKGHRTIVASEKGKIYINPTGNAGMATAGSGDVLTGMIAAFLAQGLGTFEAAKWGAYIHGLAGDIAAKQRTKLAMIASDIIDCIPNALRSLE